MKITMLEKKSRFFFCISVMLVLVLVPISQTFPLNLVQPQTASAQGNVSLRNVQHTNGIASNTITLSSFSAGTSSGRLLVVGIEANNQSATSVTFGTYSLTKVAGSFHNQYTAFWYLKNPIGTNNIIVTMAGATQVVVGAYVFSGVDEANPIPTTATNFGVGNPKITLTTEFSNSTVIDSAAIFGGATLSSPTCATQEWNVNMANKITGASSLKTLASADSVTCSWTASVTGDGWDDAAIEIKAAGIDNDVTPIVLNGKSTASGSAGTSSTSVTLYNFNPGSGSNLLLVVGVDSNAKSVSSIKFGAVSLTPAVSHFVNNDAEFWYLKNPSSTPANLVVTLSTSTQSASFVIGAYSFFGVDQANPIPTTAGTNNTHVSSPTITITTANPNSWVLDSPSIYGGVTLSSPTCSQQWDVNVPTSSTNKITGASSSTLVPTSRSVTCSWTASGSGDFWDDVALEIKAVSLTASTGILEPLYNGPYSQPNCNKNSCFNWGAVNATKKAHPNVPLFAIVNPNSGPCYSDCLSTDNPRRDFQNGIGNLTQQGVIVLGYVFTGNANPNYPGIVKCCPYVSWSKGNVTEWANWYKSSGVSGILFDAMDPNGVGSNSQNLDYYQNLTNYTKSLGFTYAFGNAGTQLERHFISSGAADTINIFENSYVPGISANLSPYTFANNASGYDKHNFSFLSWNQPMLPSNTTIGFQSNFTSFMFYTNNTASDLWAKIPPYLTTLSHILDKSTAVITFNSTNSSGYPITGYLVKVSAVNGTLFPSGYTPYSYLGQVNHQYVFTPQGHGTCTFNHWKNGPSTAARTMTVNSTSVAFTVVYSGTSCP